jgi:hypothetical protein
LAATSPKLSETSAIEGFNRIPSPATATKSSQ